MEFNFTNDDDGNIIHHVRRDNNDYRVMSGSTAIEVFYSVAIREIENGFEGFSIDIPSIKKTGQSKEEVLLRLLRTFQSFCNVAIHNYGALHNAKQKDMLKQ